MIRKIQANRDLRFVFIPKAVIELMGLEKGQDVDIRVNDGKIIITPATPYKDAASAFAVFLLFAKTVSCHVLNMLSSTVTSLSNAFIVLFPVLLSGKVYKTICNINLKVILMGGVIGPAEMERIRKNREKKKKQ
jgi:bifunctional DNA-binding transcriptional regulator/antitoxin component of YhaV-PrlF toxin-antitoxin module